MLRLVSQSPSLIEHGEQARDQLLSLLAACGMSRSHIVRFTVEGFQIMSNVGVVVTALCRNDAGQWWCATWGSNQDPKDNACDPLCEFDAARLRRDWDFGTTFWLPVSV